VSETLEQDPRRKRRGGITGLGFLPGQSGNPNGRPRSRGLLTAIRARIGDVDEGGKTIEERLVDVLLQEALKGRHRLAAVLAVFDRMEGRPSLHLDFNDVSADLRSRSTEDLKHYLNHHCWPEDEGQGGPKLDESEGEPDERSGEK